MTTELVLLLSIVVFVLMGSFVGNGKGPRNAFATGGPQLAARVEKQLATGRDFPVRPGTRAGQQYRTPTSAAPTSEF